MAQITLSWTNFKSAVGNRTLTIQYVDSTDYYYLYAFDTNLELSLMLNKDGGTEVIDFETNYKNTARII